MLDLEQPEAKLNELGGQARLGTPQVLKSAAVPLRQPGRRKGPDGDSMDALTREPLSGA